MSIKEVQCRKLKLCFAMASNNLVIKNATLLRLGFHRVFQLKNFGEGFSTQAWTKICRKTKTKQTIKQTQQQPQQNPEPEFLSEFLLS